MSDLWIFGYGSLIWRPDFDFTERRPAKVHGWHRALKMWSRVNRGTPQNPGLVFALLPGGSCHGVVLRVPSAFEPERQRMAYVLGDIAPKKLTPQRARVLEIDPRYALDPDELAAIPPVSGGAGPRISAIVTPARLFPDSVTRPEICSTPPVV